MDLRELYRLLALPPEIAGRLERTGAAPALVPLLPERSNILLFQRRFSIRSVDREDREFMEWLFQAPADAGWEDLPDRTRLQRSVKALLRGGGTVGSACGRMEKRNTEV